MSASSLLTRVALLSLVVLAPSCKYLPFGGSDDVVDPGIDGDTSGYSEEDLAELEIQRAEQRRIAQLEQDKEDAAEALRKAQDDKDDLAAAAAKKKEEVAKADLKRASAKRRSSRRKGSLRLALGNPDHDSFLQAGGNVPTGYEVDVENGSYFSFEAENGDMDGVAGVFGLSITDASFTAKGTGSEFDLSLLEFFGGARFGKMLTADFRFYGDLGFNMNFSNLDVTFGPGALESDGFGVTGGDSDSEASVGFGVYYGLGVEYYIGDDFSIFADYRALFSSEHEYILILNETYDTQSIDYSRIAFGIGFTH